MRQQAMGFVRGMGAGLMAGAALAVVGYRMRKDNRGFRHRADKTMRVVGEMLDNMQEMFR